MEKYLIFRPGLSVSLFSHEKALLFNADETLGIRFESCQRGENIFHLQRFVKLSHRHETNTPC